MIIQLLESLVCDYKLSGTKITIHFKSINLYWLCDSMF
jgi:hypothetical protein